MDGAVGATRAGARSSELDRAGPRDQEHGSGLALSLAHDRSATEERGMLPLPRGRQRTLRQSSLAAIDSIKDTN
jgi:hypothetical protein